MSSTSNDPASESLVAVLWPSIAAFPLGRRVGRWCAVRAGPHRALTLGKLLALATIPVSLALYFWRLAPWVCRRYRITDRRVTVLEGLCASEGASLGLGEFDALDVEVLPGQKWLRAGDLVFRRQGNEVMRWPGVPHPEAARQLCLKTRRGVLAVQRVLAEQAAG